MQMKIINDENNTEISSWSSYHCGLEAKNHVPDCAISRCFVIQAFRISLFTRTVRRLFVDPPRKRNSQCSRHHSSAHPHWTNRRWSRLSSGGRLEARKKGPVRGRTTRPRARIREWIELKLNHRDRSVVYNGVHEVKMMHGSLYLSHAKVLWIDRRPKRGTGPFMSRSQLLDFRRYHDSKTSEEAVPPSHIGSECVLFTIWLLLSVQEPSGTEVSKRKPL